MTHEAGDARKLLEKLIVTCEAGTDHGSRNRPDAYIGDCPLCSALEAARAYLAQPVAQPVVVPREPTEAMIAAGWGHKDVETLWRAMYDAAPAQPPCRFRRGCLHPNRCQRAGYCDSLPVPDAAPAQAEPRDEHSLDYIAEEYMAATPIVGTGPSGNNGPQGAVGSAAAPSPAAEDGLVERLRSWAQNEEMVDSWHTKHGRDCNEAAAHIERQAQEIAEMKRERQARNAIDPVTRLHNICDAMAEDRADSPYSQEAWDAQDEAYREKCADLAAALRWAEALHTAVQSFRCGCALASELRSGWIGFTPEQAIDIEQSLIDHARKVGLNMPLVIRVGGQGDDRG